LTHTVCGSCFTTKVNSVSLIVTSSFLTPMCCRRDGSLTTLQCICRVYQQDGIRGFYRGLTASYYGIIETAIHFVIYERLRAKLVELRARRRPRDNETFTAGHVRDFLEYMAAAGTSKGIATCVGYPHGGCPCFVRLDRTVFHLTGVLFGTPSPCLNASNALDRLKTIAVCWLADTLLENLETHIQYTTLIIHPHYTHKYGLHCH